MSGGNGSGTFTWDTRNEPTSTVLAPTGPVSYWIRVSATDNGAPARIDADGVQITLDNNTPPVAAITLVTGTAGNITVDFNKTCRFAHLSYRPPLPYYSHFLQKLRTLHH